MSHPPSLVTVAVGVATGGAGVPGIIATALTAGLGSGATEYGASFLQSFSDILVNYGFSLSLIK